MFPLIWSRRFERSYKKIKHSGQFDRERLRIALGFLRDGTPFPFHYKDHALEGEYLGCRECHLKGDICLIYEIRESLKDIVLVDIGSHSELFG